MMIVAPGPFDSLRSLKVSCMTKKTTDFCDSDTEWCARPMLRSAELWSASSHEISSNGV